MSGSADAVKESKALTMECPMARNQPNKNDRKCLASGCIAWRWVIAPTNGETNRGYCGMVPR